MGISFADFKAGQHFGKVIRSRVHGALVDIMIGRFLLEQLAEQPLRPRLTLLVSQNLSGWGTAGDTKELLASKWIHSACLVKAGV